MQTTTTKKPQIWAIGGGKGGIGKSFVTANLAITAAKHHKKVIVVDLDLGGANLHTCLGAGIPTKTLADLLTGKAGSAKELLCETTTSNLKLICGANDPLTIANLTPEQYQKIMSHLLTLDCDYLLLDLGAGTHQNTLEAFNMADKGIVTITPEPTSIENAYRFIKSAHYSFLRKIEKELKLDSVIEYAMDPKNKMGIKTPHDLIQKVSELNPKEGAKFKQLAENYKLFIILNQARTLSDIESGESVTAVCKKYFNIDTHYVGHLDYDNSVWQSIRKQRPIVLEHPYSQFVMTFNQIAKILEENEKPTTTDLLRAA